MTHEAIVQITMTARDLAAGAIGDVTENIGKVGSAATAAASKVGSAFSGMGRAMSVGLGSAVDSLVTGGGLGQAALTMAGFMAGEFTENFGGQIIEKLAGSSVVAAIAAPLGAVGSSIGAIIAAAIPVGMALLPALLIGAIIAAVTILIVNEGIRNKVISFASGLIGTLIRAIGGFLEKLPAVVGAAFGKAWSFVVDSVLPVVGQIVTLWFTLPFRLAGLGLEIVRTIIGGLVSLPGRLADVIRDAIAGIHIDIGPFHLSSRGFRVDAPSIPDLSGLIPSFAVGAWKLPADTLAQVHKGEMIVPADLAGRLRGERGSSSSPVGASSGASVVLQGVTDAELERIIDRRMYFTLQRAVPTADRV